MTAKLLDTSATLYLAADAQEIADMLNETDKLGFRYEVEDMGSDYCRIAAYQDGKFYAYL